jgi:hypothetical protein
MPCTSTNPTAHFAPHVHGNKNLPHITFCPPPASRLRSSELATVVPLFFLPWPPVTALLPESFSL